MKIFKFFKTNDWNKTFSAYVATTENDGFMPHLKWIFTANQWKVLNQLSTKMLQDAESLTNSEISSKILTSFCLTMFYLGQSENKTSKFIQIKAHFG